MVTNDSQRRKEMKTYIYGKFIKQTNKSFKFTLINNSGMSKSKHKHIKMAIFNSKFALKTYLAMTTTSN